MQFKAVILALAATAVATPNPIERRSLGVLSIYNALTEALPTSLAQALTSAPMEASAAIASEFANGNTPSWYTNLPSDVQTWLTAQTTGTAAPTGAVTGGSGSVGIASHTNGTTLASKTSKKTGASASKTGAKTTSGGSSASGSGSGSGSGSASSSAAASSSTGAASMPTAVIGAGLAGALGVVGMLAL